VHIKNFIANRTTNERFAGRQKKQAVRDDSDEEDSLESSIMNTSDFERSLAESILSDGSGAQKNKATRGKRKRGCFGNCWKFTTHRNIMPQ
jgi:hypothetical protein